MPDLRHRHRRGSSGKRTYILSLIEHWWDQLEGDFAKILHVDARDFLRGDRCWAQFLVYAKYVADEDGGRLWAGQLSDDRFLPQFEEELKKAREKAKTAKDPARPSLAGYSREVDALHTVANEVRLLRAELGKWGYAPPILGPLFPHERIEQLHDQQEIAQLGDIVEMGKRNWREANRA